MTAKCAAGMGSLGSPSSPGSYCIGRRVDKRLQRAQHEQRWTWQCCMAQWQRQAAWLERVVGARLVAPLRFQRKRLRYSYALASDLGNLELVGGLLVAVVAHLRFTCRVRMVNTLRLVMPQRI